MPQPVIDDAEFDADMAHLYQLLDALENAYRDADR